MENKEFRFRTNLNCNGCISKVKADLDNAEGVDKWNVDINTSDKILTVKSKGITTDEVAAIVKSKGFKADLVDS